VNSDTEHDPIDDQICESQELSTSAEACPQPQNLSSYSHRPKMTPGILGNNVTPKRASPLYIDLSEFRMPAITANRARRARRGGSGFDGVLNAEVLPDNKAKRYQKKQNTRKLAMMGKLTLVNARTLHVPHADLEPAFATDQPVRVESGVIGRRQQQIPAVPSARQHRLRGGTGAGKRLPITGAVMDPVIPGLSLAKKSQRRVSFASDLCTQFPPSKPYEPPEKCATMDYSGRNASGRIVFSFPPSAVKKRRVMLDQEIYEQFARVTAPARKEEPETDDGTDSSNDGSLEEWDDQGSITGRSESESLGKDDEEEEEVVDNRKEERREKMLAEESGVEGVVTDETSMPPTQRLPLSRVTSLRELTRRTSLGYGTLPASARQPLRGRQTPFLIPFRKTTDI
jgi:hypothetical protein